MTSMTGFGYAEGEGAGAHISLEIKSLNTRYLDMIVSLPSSLSMMEPRIREKLQTGFIRGRLEVTVRSRDIEEQLTVTVDEKAAKAWKKALEELSGILGGGQSITLEMVTGKEGVIKADKVRDPEAYWAVIQDLLARSMDQVIAMREREGVELHRDIEAQLLAVEKSLAVVLGRAPEVRKTVEEGLRRRFQEILGDDTGEQRVLQETAAWIARMDINEEIVRLESHLRAFREESAIQGALGKKLDFLAQEMGREINTIGSKSPDAEVSREVVNMKDSLEKVREQLRNVE